MSSELLQTGIYTVPEAARLTRVSSWRIRRWLKGYKFKVKDGQHHSPAIWNSQIDPIEHTVALGFLDLLEICFVDAFISAGVTWRTLRQVHERATKLVGHNHPFCTNQFATDGQAVFMKICENSNESTLWDMRDLQRVFECVLRPFLMNIEFDGATVPLRWWPNGKAHLVALDPRRSFGQPIIFRDGVPTSALARSVNANGSLEKVAQWFEVPLSSVREAVDYERALAA